MLFETAMLLNKTDASIVEESSKTESKAFVLIKISFLKTTELREK